MPAAPRGKIYDSILDTMGGTPLVRFPRITAGLPADLCFKLEFFNPIASVKDRIGIAMVEAMEKAGTLSRAERSSSRPLAIRALRLLSRRRPKAIRPSSSCPSK